MQCETNKMEGKNTDIDDDDVEIISWPDDGLQPEIRKKMLSHSPTTDNLEALLEDYKRTIRKTAQFCKKNPLRDNMVKHLMLFNSYYHEAKRNFVIMPEYFQKMEGILTLYVSLELVIASSVHRRNTPTSAYVTHIKNASRRICNVLSIVLQYKEKHCIHVLLKVDCQKRNSTAQDVLKLLYNYFLILSAQEDKDTPETFCRSYLLLQKWKDMQPQKDHELMDKKLLERFEKPSSYVKENNILRSILIPSENKYMDPVAYLKDVKNAPIKVYFEHMRNIEKNLGSDEVHSVGSSVDLVLEDDTATNVEGICDEASRTCAAILKCYSTNKNKRRSWVDNEPSTSTEERSNDKNEQSVNNLFNSILQNFKITESGPKNLNEKHFPRKSRLKHEKRMLTICSFLNQGNLETLSPKKGLEVINLDSDDESPERVHPPETDRLDPTGWQKTSQKEMAMDVNNTAVNFSEGTSIEVASDDSRASLHQIPATLRIEDTGGTMPEILTSDTCHKKSDILSETVILSPEIEHTDRGSINRIFESAKDDHLLSDCAGVKICSKKDSVSNKLDSIEETKILVNDNISLESSIKVHSTGTSELGESVFQESHPITGPPPLVNSTDNLTCPMELEIIPSSSEGRCSTFSADTKNLDNSPKTVCKEVIENELISEVASITVNAKASYLEESDALINSSEKCLQRLSIDSQHSADLLTEKVIVKEIPVNQDTTSNFEKSIDVALRDMGSSVPCEKISDYNVVIANESSSTVDVNFDTSAMDTSNLISTVDTSTTSGGIPTTQTPEIVANDHAIIETKDANVQSCSAVEEQVSVVEQPSSLDIPSHSEKVCVEVQTDRVLWELENVKSLAPMVEIATPYQDLTDVSNMCVAPVTSREPDEMDTSTSDEHFKTVRSEASEFLFFNGGGQLRSENANNKSVDMEREGEPEQNILLPSQDPISDDAETKSNEDPYESTEYITVDPASEGYNGQLKDVDQDDQYYEAPEELCESTQQLTNTSPNDTTLETICRTNLSERQKNANVLDICDQLRVGDVILEIKSQKPVDNYQVLCYSGQESQSSAEVSLLSKPDHINNNIKKVEEISIFKCNGKLENSKSSPFKLKEMEPETPDKVQASVNVRRLMNVFQNEAKPAEEARLNSTEGKVMFTSTNTIKQVPLADFANFEKANYSELTNGDANMEDIFSGPISQVRCKESFTKNCNSNDNFSLLFAKNKSSELVSSGLLSPASSFSNNSGSPPHDSNDAYHNGISIDMPNPDLSSKRSVFNGSKLETTNQKKRRPELRTDYIKLDMVVPPIENKADVHYKVQQEKSLFNNSSLNKNEPTRAKKKSRVKFSDELQISEVPPSYNYHDDRLYKLQKRHQLPKNVRMSDHMRRHIAMELEWHGLEKIDQIDLNPSVDLVFRTPSELMDKYIRDLREEYSRKMKAMQFTTSTTKSCIQQRYFVDKKNGVLIPADGITDNLEAEKHSVNGLSSEAGMVKDVVTLCGLSGDASGLLDQEGSISGDNFTQSPMLSAFDPMMSYHQESINSSTKPAELIPNCQSNNATSNIPKEPKVHPNEVPLNVVENMNFSSECSRESGNAYDPTIPSFISPVTSLRYSPMLSPRENSVSPRSSPELTIVCSPSSTGAPDIPISDLDGPFYAPSPHDSPKRMPSLDKYEVKELTVPCKFYNHRENFIAQEESHKKSHKKHDESHKAKLERRLEKTRKKHKSRNKFHGNSVEEDFVRNILTEKLELNQAYSKGGLRVKDDKFLLDSTKDEMTHSKKKRKHKHHSKEKRRKKSMARERSMSEVEASLREVLMENPDRYGTTEEFSDGRSEFSNSPKFLPDAEKLVERCLSDEEKPPETETIRQNLSFLSDNSNFYNLRKLNAESPQLQDNSELKLCNLSVVEYQKQVSESEATISKDATIQIKSDQNVPLDDKNTQKIVTPSQNTLIPLNMMIRPEYNPINLLPPSTTVLEASNVPNRKVEPSKLISPLISTTIPPSSTYMNDPFIPKHHITNLIKPSYKCLTADSPEIEGQDLSHEGEGNEADLDDADENELIDRLLQSINDKRKPLKKRMSAVKIKAENGEPPSKAAKTEEISYPATPMISIAEVEALAAGFKIQESPFKSEELSFRCQDSKFQMDGVCGMDSSFKVQKTPFKIEDNRFNLQENINIKNFNVQNSTYKMQMHKDAYKSPYSSEDVYKVQGMIYKMQNDTFKTENAGYKKENETFDVHDGAYEVQDSTYIGRNDSCKIQKSAFKLQEGSYEIQDGTRRSGSAKFQEGHFKKQDGTYNSTEGLCNVQGEVFKREDKHETRGNESPTNRIFKTPAERKEMPPLPTAPNPSSMYYNVNPEPSPIITDQFNINNHTYNNPIINYHVNGVPVVKVRYPAYYPMLNPPMLFPFNNIPIYRPCENVGGSEQQQGKPEQQQKHNTSGKQDPQRNYKT